MSKQKEYIVDKFEDFWTDIYNIEKEEVKTFYDYFVYSKEKMRGFVNFNYTYENVEQLLINKHFDYLNEMYSNILIGNYNSVATMLRIIIENYVTYFLIKKYKKESLYKDWVLWSTYKGKAILNESKYQRLAEESYCELEKALGLRLEFTNQSFSWIKRVVKLKSYSIKTICKNFLDEQIYTDYSYLSALIHNDDYNTKIFTFFDKDKLTNFIYAAFNYTDKLIGTYDKRYLRDKTYNFLSIKVLEALDNVGKVEF